jgi:hypothetical protein
MITKNKSNDKDLSDLKVKAFNDIDFLSEDLMKKMVQRERARVERTSEILCITAVSFENLLANSKLQIVSDNQIKIFFKSVEKLQRNVRETDLVGWIKKNTTFGIVFTVEKTISKEIIENRMKEILEIQLINTNGENVEIDVTMLSAEQECNNDRNVKNSVQNYFKKKNQFMNQESNES